MTAALAGAAAGLGVAVPVGAVGVLLLQESLRGRRAAVAGACAVAGVDLLYACAAVLLGPHLSGALADREAWVRLGAALVLGVIAVRGVLAGVRPSASESPSAAGARQTFVRFAGLTLVNPTTALYFTALTAGQGRALEHSGGLVFVLAVFAASLVWQQLLVAAGSLAGTRIGVRARSWTFRVGYGIVAAYAVRLALPLP